MAFRLVLWLLALRLRWLGKRNEEVRARIAQQSLVMIWRTQSCKPARWFYFNPAGVSSGRGLHSAPKTTLNFKDAAYAFRILREASKNQIAFMQGMQAVDIKVEGDAAGLMCIMTLMPYLPPGGNRKKQFFSPCCSAKGFFCIISCSV